MQLDEADGKRVYAEGAELEAAAALSPTLHLLTPENELQQQIAEIPLDVHSLSPENELEPLKEIPVHVGLLVPDSELEEIEGADELEELLEVLKQVETRLDEADQELRSQTPIGVEIEDQPQDKYVCHFYF